MFGVADPDMLQFMEEHPEGAWVTQCVTPDGHRHITWGLGEPPQLNFRPSPFGPIQDPKRL